MRARVRLHDVDVGRLEQSQELTTFRFTAGYLEMPQGPVLGRWFEDRLGPDVLGKRSQGQLPPFFQNVLPEVNGALRTLLAQRARVPENRELRLLAALGEDLPGRADFEELVRRLVFSILCQNPDAHLKNWSFWYPDRRRPRLSPAYDFVSATVYPSVHRELACRLAGEWEPSAIRPHHFGVLASRAGYPVSDGVALAEAAGQRIRDAWAALPTQHSVPDDLRAAVSQHLDRTKLP